MAALAGSRVFRRPRVEVDRDGEACLIPTPAKRSRPDGGTVRQREKGYEEKKKKKEKKRVSGDPRLSFSSEGRQRDSRSSLRSKKGWRRREGFTKPTECVRRF